MPRSKNRRKKPKKRKAPAQRRPITDNQKHDKIFYLGNNMITYSDNLIDRGEDCDDER